MKASRRHSRKKRGVINVAYLRHERDWILLASPGRHEPTKEGWIDWREAESGSLRNCSRGQPIYAYGYSITLVRGDYLRKQTPNTAPQQDGKIRVRVQISRRGRALLREQLLRHACSRNEEWFARQFWNLPFEPYAPVRKQLLSLLRQINVVRKKAGLRKLSTNVIRYRRDLVSVYADSVRAQPSDTTTTR